MANNIQTLILSGAGSWSNAIYLERYPTGKVKFRVIGGTFDNDVTDLEVTADNFGMYNFVVHATPPTKQYESKHVTVYYDYAGQWILIQAASRNIVIPVSKVVAPKIMFNGFDALSGNDTLNPLYAGVIIGGGTATADNASFDPIVPKKISTLAIESTFDYKKTILFVPDKANSKIHWLTSTNVYDDIKLYGTLNLSFVSAFAYFSPATHRRTVVVFQADGTIRPYNVQMVAQATTKLSYRVVRAVWRKTSDPYAASFYVFDDKGQIHLLDSSFNELSVMSDQYYVDAHESLNAFITRDGKLVGTDVLTDITDISFYQFIPNSTVAYGISLPISATSTYKKFDITANALTGTSPTVSGDLLRYNTTASWDLTGGTVSAGKETLGTRALANIGSDVVQTNQENWSYLSVTAAPAATAGDQRFVYVARPTTDLKHVITPTYSTLLPSYDVPLGQSVVFSFTANFDTKDDVLPIRLPDGINWTATVGNVPVTSVRNGETVTVIATHPYLTSQPFPFSVGRSQGLVEVIPDPMPDPFIFETIYDVPDYSWQQTVEQRITGVNQSIELRVKVDGAEDDSRVEIYVNGILKPAPVLIANNDTFYFRVHHGYNITQVDVTAGEYETSYGIYTVSEIQFPPIPNRAYATVGKEYRTPVLLNSGISALSLSINGTAGEFIQGGKEITLEIGQSTQILFTPTEVAKTTVFFGSSRYSYEWKIWTDDTWQDAVPPEVRSERYVLASSAPINFDNIPENFFTDLSCPAGLLLSIDGVIQQGEVDSRGVYKTGIELKDVSCDSILKIKALPAHDQPYTLTFGKATVGWLHDFTTDPTYQYGFESVGTLINNVFESISERVFAPITLLYQTQKNAVKDLFERTFLSALRYKETETLQSYKSVTPAATSVPMAYDFAMDSAVFTPLVYNEWKEFVVSNVSMPALFNASEYQTQVTAGNSFVDVNDTKVILSNVNSFASAFETIVLENGIVLETRNEISYHEHLLQAGKVNWNEVINADSSKARSVNWNDVIEMAASEAQVLEEVHNFFDAAPPKIYEVNATPKRENAEPDYITFAYSSKETEHQFTDPVVAGHVDTTIDWYKQAPSANKDAFEPHIILMYSMDSSKDAMIPAAIDSLSNYKYSSEYEWTRDAIYYHDKNEPNPIIYVQPATSFERPLPRWFELNAEYEISPYGQFVFAAISYKYLNVPEQAKLNNVYKEDSVIEFTQVNAAIASQGSAPRILSTVYHRQENSKPNLVELQKIKGEEFDARVITDVTYSSDGLKHILLTATTDFGNPDPLTKGYFATELEALQNATDVWNKTPEEVYGIQQLDGSWTWAIVIPCGEYCGDFGCDMRGYIAGG